MSLARKTTPRAALLCTVLILGGCASDDRYDNYTALPKQLFNQIKTTVTGGPERPDGYGIDPAALAATEFAILGAGYGEVKAGLILEEFSADSEVYRSPDGVEIALTDMVVRRVAGLGADMRGVYISPDDPAYRGFHKTANEGTRYIRAMEFLNEGIPSRFTVECALEPLGEERVELILDSYDTILYEEVCREDEFFPELTFTNAYWVGETGQVWRSRQWIGPQAEFPLVLEALNPASDPEE